MVWSALSALILSAHLLCIEGLLRPHRAVQGRGHFDKKAIKAHIEREELQRARSKPSIRTYLLNDERVSASSSGSASEDLTTATEVMWESCEPQYFVQDLDHFGSGIGPDGVTTFQQRYYVCGRSLFNWKSGDPVFVYFGNEADVTAYIDYTGFMWENAADFNALLVFMEHRYYGESLPYSQAEIVESTAKLQYCTTDQALYDYAVLLDALKKTDFASTSTSLHAQTDTDSVSSSPIIGFGGSYGGMLAAWFRMKYPAYVDGVIAGSAPVFGLTGLTPEPDPYGFAAKETFDASVDVGVDNALCQYNIEQGWDNIMELASSASGRQQLYADFNLCSVPSSVYEASALFYILEESIAYMSMSSYPYASNYISGAIMGTDGALPAYPMTYACNENLAQSFDSASDRVAALAGFNAVFWNSDGQNDCIDLDASSATYASYIWDFLYCRSLLIPSGSLGGEHDMMWEAEWDADGTIDWCQSEYDIYIDPNGPASRQYGGRNIYKTASNIVFSNGDMDPWMSLGVLESPSESLVSLTIEAAGHHLDLMFSNSADPDSVVQARQFELQQIEQWIAQANSEWKMGMCDVQNAFVEKKAHPFIAAMNMLL